MMPSRGSESPTHPDAPRAGGETPVLDNDFANAYPTLSALAVRYGTVKAELLDLLATRPDQERYERLLADKLKWFEEAAASDRAVHALVDDTTLSETLGEIRHFAPAATHWALNLAMSRLLARHRDGERETVCGMRFVVDRTIPPGEIHMRQDGRVVARLINVTDGEVAVGSAPPSPERASK